MTVRIRSFTGLTLQETNPLCPADRIENVLRKLPVDPEGAGPCWNHSSLPAKCISRQQLRTADQRMGKAA